ncbi:hypothetical protein C6B38_03145 [Spiroplasma sp. ChiS]|uniref:hypothetical protein n=1 Tax=Spiroplasma sp. ChiS TaxID=2099885 RepID=UPI000CF8F969|nr:hypothetical protein [Spiroplasma sp. ChiS]PQP78918.1 hypothetical protein C6B38_03145 [Spiroplasma sp. ChiS]
MPNWLLLLIIGNIIFWVFVIVIITIVIINQNKKINETVEQEIEDKLKQLNHNNYVWKDNQNYYNLKNELRCCIMDNRKTFPSFSRAYNNNSTTKKKEIYNIVKKYLELDKQYQK